MITAEQTKFAEDIYELSRVLNSHDDDFFYAVEEMGELMKEFNKYRKFASNGEKMSREIAQTIIQIQKVTYRLGLTSRVEAYYLTELNILKAKLEEQKRLAKDI